MGDVNSDLGFVLNQTPSATQAMPGPLEAQVISADATGVRVTVPSFHPELAFGPARYSWPVTGYPPAGTSCLVAFTGDDLTRPWIMAWDTAPETPLELPGATVLTRYVGGTSLGHPTTGTFALGDFVVAQDGTTWVCTVGGSPGTWKANYQGAALSGAVAATRYAGGTASGPPVTGTFIAGDFVVDQTGSLWICTAAGTPGTWTAPHQRPTGDIEPSLLPTPKPGTLLLNGQLVSRTTYARLWAWVQANALVTATWFTNGDNSTTFGLPDLRGRVLSGADTTNPLAALFGAATYSAAGLPVHTHTVPDHDPHDHVSLGTNGAGDHHHGINNDDGNHGFHNGGSDVEASAAPGAQDHFFSVADSTGVGNAAHSHFGGTGTDGSHTHVVDIQTASAGGHTVGTSGTGTSVSLRPPSASVNFLIWT